MCLSLSFTKPDPLLEKYPLGDIIAEIKKIVVPQTATENIIVFKKLNKQTHDKKIKLDEPIYKSIHVDFTHNKSELQEEKRFFEVDLEKKAYEIQIFILNEVRESGTTRGHFRRMRGDMFFGHPMFDEMLIELRMLIDEIKGERKVIEAKELSISDVVQDRLTGFDLNYGFHSWSKERSDKENCNSTVNYNNSALCKFVIPIGAKYFEKNGHYVSDSIIFEEEV